METALSLNSSSPTTPQGKLLSEEELDALGWLDVMLRDGQIALRSRLTRIQNQGLDAQMLYRNVVDSRQKILADEGRPPMRLPTWEEVAPTTPAPSTPDGPADI